MAVIFPCYEHNDSLANVLQHSTKDFYICIYIHIYTYTYEIQRSFISYIYIYLRVYVCFRVLHFPTDLDHIIFFINNTDEYLRLKQFLVQQKVNSDSNSQLRRKLLPSALRKSCKQKGNRKYGKNYSSHVCIQCICTHVCVCTLVCVYKCRAHLPSTHLEVRTQFLFTYFFCLWILWIYDISGQGVIGGPCQR